MSSLPLTPAMVCQFKLFFYTFPNKAMVEDARQMPPGAFTVGSASAEECSGEAQLDLCVTL